MGEDSGAPFPVINSCVSPTVHYYQGESERLLSKENFPLKLQRKGEIPSGALR